MTNHMANTNKNREMQTLTGRQRKQLRALGHHLSPVVYVGKEGISTTVLKAISDAITVHELIKVKLGQNCPLQKREAADALADKSDTTLVQLIGKTVLLYLRNPDLPPEKQISV